MIGPTRKIVIIGGGLSGLSAAFYIRKFYKEAGIKPDIVLLEKRKTSVERLKPYIAMVL